MARWKNIRYGKDLRQLRLQQLEQALNGRYGMEAGDVTAKRHRSAAVKASAARQGPP